MSAEITLRDVYEQQLRAAADVANIRADVAALTARVDVQLAHGQRKMDALEHDVDGLKERIPERLSDRLTSLESDRDKNQGRSGLRTGLISGLLAFTGGSGGGVLITWLLHGGGH